MQVNRHKLTMLAAIVPTLVLGSPVTNAQKMYWTTPTDWDDFKIRRADLDGSNVEDLVVREPDTPLEVALDLGAGKMYWTDSNGSTGRVVRSNLDGSGVQALVFGLRSPSGIALDPDAGKDLKGGK